MQHFRQRLVAQLQPLVCWGAQLVQK